MELKEILKYLRMCDQNISNGDYGCGDCFYKQECTLSTKVILNALEEYNELCTSLQYQIDKNYIEKGLE